MAIITKAFSFFLTIKMRKNVFSPVSSKTAVEWQNFCSLFKINDEWLKSKKAVELREKVIYTLSAYT